MTTIHNQTRIIILAIIVLLALCGLVARLWWVQVASEAYYASRIQGSSQVTVRIPAVRGEIRDRNGVVLADNRASYDVDFYLPDMVKGYRERSGGVPIHSYQWIGRGGMLEERETADIVRVVNEAVLPRLQQLGLAEDYNGARLQKHYINDVEVPFTYREDIDFTTMAQFAERDVGLPGVRVAIKPVRRYVYGALAGHVLGYVGAPDDIRSEEDVGDYNFYQADIEGKASVELFMDEYLRGEPGVRIMRRNAKGVIEGVEGIVDPAPGDTVYLTIDARVQYIAEQALREGGVGRGAAVVVDPDNGDILALASVPSFDPNTFIPSISPDDWNALTGDETNPLLNRAISGYAPGSTYKIPIGLAGMYKGLSPRIHFTCTGGVTYGDTFMRCWIHSKGGAHGSLELADAIKKSCNAFFYQFGNATGIDAIAEVGGILGLGSKAGLPVTGESPGVLPDRDYFMRHHRMRPTRGFVANVSIGQGDVLATPLQMAMVTATVANGGISYLPRLIDRVVAANGEVTMQRPPARRGVLRDKGMTDAQIEVVRRGMWKVVNEGGGTARRARLDGIEVAGKTGTAQFWRDGVKDNHAWFICFAPYEQPEYAICVFVQGAKAGGQVAAPVAARILDESFALDSGDDFQLAALEPAAGSFKFISQIDFGRAIPAAYGAADDAPGEAAAASTGAAPQEQAASATPNLRPEADERGRVIPRAEPVRSGQNRPNFFQRLFRGGGDSGD